MTDKGLTAGLRPMIAADIPEATALIARVWTKEYAALARDEFTGHGTFYVLEQDGKIVALGGYGDCAWIGWGVYSLCWISVAPERRGRGFGSMIVERCLADLRPIANLIVLGTQTAVSFYERVGFRAAARWGTDTLMVLESHSSPTKAGEGDGGERKSGDQKPESISGHPQGSQETAPVGDQSVIGVSPPFPHLTGYSDFTPIRTLGRTDGPSPSSSPAEERAEWTCVICNQPIDPLKPRMRGRHGWHHLHCSSGLGAPSSSPAAGEGLKPCPFCQAALIHHAGGMTACHPTNDCWLGQAGDHGGGYELDICDFESWNRRPKKN